MYLDVYSHKKKKRKRKEKAFSNLNEYLYLKCFENVYVGFINSKIYRQYQIRLGQL